MSNLRKQASYWLLPAFFSTIILLILLINPLISTRLQIISQGQVIYNVQVGEKTLEVTFRHSVNKGLIREIYRLDPVHGKLALETGYFESYGAGMLDTVPAGVSLREAGKFLVLDFPLSYQASFAYRAGPEAQHTFFYGGDILPLYEMVPMKDFEISLVQIRLRKHLESWLKTKGKDVNISE